MAIRDTELVYWAADSEEGTTNQRMELRAILEALKYAQSVRRPNERVMIFSDSAYAVNCYTQQWYEKWRRNGWRNSKDEDVANQDLWSEIVPFFDNFWYTLRKVEGHNGVYWNEECDRMAQTLAGSLKMKRLKELENGI